ncbi:uncharacterized protein VNE69_02223 [Vairimorpha necatrix]|uniref:Uncharacterized protein n=1 Tax=Vairimorpha necatrix TaxID=6039 RepID=A0AAX4J9R5_9MICR
MDETYFSNKMKINPPFLYRNIKKSVHFKGKVDFPCLPTCCIVKFKLITCSSKKYKEFRLIGYTTNSFYKTMTYNMKKGKMGRIDLTFVIQNCTESTFLYFYLYSKRTKKIFKIFFTGCELVNGNKIEIEDDNELLTIKYKVIEKTNRHLNIQNNKIKLYDLDNKTTIIKKKNKDNINDMDDDNKLNNKSLLEKYNFFSKNYSRGKIIKYQKNPPEILSEYLGNHLCKEIESPYKKIMMKWNNEILRNEKSLHDFLLKFIERHITREDRLEFVYLFYNKRLINKMEFIKIINQIKIN